MKNQCSELFGDVFHSHCGGIVRTCDCGRTHYNAADSSFFDEGELEDLVEKTKIYPDKYFATDYTITTMEIGSSEIVCGCVCNLAQRWEAVLIEQGQQIAQYLNSRAKALKEESSAIEVSF